VGIFADAYYKARGADYMRARTGVGIFGGLGRPDMGSRLSSYGKQEGTPFSYWTVRGVDGLFQDWDARRNLGIILEEMGLIENVREFHYDPYKERDENWGPGYWFNSWTEEFEIAVKVAQNVEANDELREYLRVWEHADTDARRAAEKERTLKLASILTGGVTAIAAGMISSARGNDTEGDAEFQAEVEAAGARADASPALVIGGTLAAVAFVVGLMLWA